MPRDEEKLGKEGGWIRTPLPAVRLRLQPRHLGVGDERAWGTSELQRRGSPRARCPSPEAAGRPGTLLRVTPEQPRFHTSGLGLLAQAYKGRVIKTHSLIKTTTKGSMFLKAR